jgi:hypothetical protein
VERMTKGARPAGTRRNSQLSGTACAETARLDLLHRFTPTPHVTDLLLMQRTVRLETNNEAVLALVLKFFERHQHERTGQPEFVWRIVCEPDPKVESTGVPLAAFSDPGLRYVNVGQRGFLSVDLDRREATGFLSELFFRDEPRFKHRPPLDILFCMSAASLGFVALSAGCAGSEDRGVLVFGPPNSGKTTASYLSAKLGMEFHADQVVFLEMWGGVLRAWGDPFPAVFRLETLEFLPELRESCRLSTYAGVSFYYYDKSALQSRWAKPFAPLCSLFLDRSSVGEPQLEQISPEDAASRLHSYMLFGEDCRFSAQIVDAISALAALPAYTLKYDSDPRIAAALIRRMLP